MPDGVVIVEYDPGWPLGSATMSAPNGRVVRYTPINGGPHLIDIIKIFETRYPACHVEIIETAMTTNQLDWLRQGEVSPRSSTTTATPASPPSPSPAYPLPEPPSSGSPNTTPPQSEPSPTPPPPTSTPTTAPLTPERFQDLPTRAYWSN